MRIAPRLLVLLAAFIVPTATYAQTADEIIAQHLDAMGGAETLRATNTVKLIGTASSQGVVFPLTVYQSQPNKMRSEVEIQGMKMIQTFDGEAGWMVNPMMGTEEPQPMPAQQVALLQEESSMDSPLLDYQEKGNTVEYVGRKTIDSTDVHVLKITRASGSELEYVLDAETMVALSTGTKVDANGQLMDVEMKFYDYKMVDGRMTAHRIDQIVNGVTASTMKADSIQFNIELDDALFSKPTAN